MNAGSEHPVPTRRERWRRQLVGFVKRPATTARRIRQWASKPARLIRRHRRVSFAVRFARSRRELSQEHGNPKRAQWWRKRAAKWAEVKRRLDKQIEAAAGQRRIIPREEWDPSPGDRQTARMSNESEGLFAHHSVAGMPSTEEGEKAEMRNLEAIARSRGFSDFSYSFAIAPSGRIYEGRGRGIEGAHTIGFNDTAHAAVAMGNYDNAEPTEAMLASYRWLCGEYLDASKFRGHRDVNPTGCPGNRLYAALFG